MPNILFLVSKPPTHFQFTFSQSIYLPSNPTRHFDLPNDLCKLPFSQTPNRINIQGSLNLQTSIFKKIRKLQIRPYLKSFFYLFLLNSLPIHISSPCPACSEPLSQNHIHQKCSFFSFLFIEPLSINNITLWIIGQASVWLTFNKLWRDSTLSLTSATHLFTSILENETNRQILLSQN